MQEKRLRLRALRVGALPILNEFIDMDSRVTRGGSAARMRARAGPQGAAAADRPRRANHDLRWVRHPECAVTPSSRECPPDTGAAAPELLLREWIAEAAEMAVALFEEVRARHERVAAAS